MDKPFKTIDEQIEILKGRNLVIDDSAALILRKEGYYPVINGYKDIFIDKAAKSAAGGEDRYKDGTNFRNIYDLFEFDRSLRLVMFRYIASAEALLKTACAYCFMERYLEGEPYLDYDNYRQERDMKKKIEDLIKDFRYVLSKDPDNQPSYKRPYIEHYINEHDSVPLWVLFNYMGLGAVFKFFCYQKESMRNKIARYFSDFYTMTHDGPPIKFTDKQLRLTYDHIKEFRNICAHDERLYCARVSPSKDTTLGYAINKDFALVIPESEMLALRIEIGQLIIDVSSKMPNPIVNELLMVMGFGTGAGLFPEG